MDTTAHRIIKQARDTLVDGLSFSTIVPATATAKERAKSIGHGLSVEQFEALVKITEDLYSLMVDDPNPPECVHCGTALVQPDTGRPRRFCSDACRQAEYRERIAGGDEQPDVMGDYLARGWTIDSEGRWHEPVG
jgi:endogenous inhibitor of DNA gyrase (YacG/DUF329 family)